MEKESPKEKRKHHGSLKSSQRQQAVLKATTKGRWYSAMDLVRLANKPNPAEIISALKANGVKIEKRQVNTGDKRYCEWRIG